MVTTRGDGGTGRQTEAKRLQGRVALVCGADGPVGRGIAQRFAQQGADIVVTGESTQLTKQTSRLIEDCGGKVLTLLHTASNRTHAERMIAEAVARFGHIDILVAAAEYRTTWEPLSEKTDAMFGISMRAFYETLWMMQATFPVMCQAGGGSIIALGSTYGHFTQRFIADYKATKEAVKGLVLSAAHEWGPFNIRVNILEAALDTREFQNYRAGHEAIVDDTIAILPMRRMGDPVRDIGGAAVFLASDDSQYLTGEIVHADGGEHLSAPVFEPRLLEEGC